MIFLNFSISFLYNANGKILILFKFIKGRHVSTTLQKRALTYPSSMESLAVDRGSFENSLISKFGSKVSTQYFFVWLSILVSLYDQKPVNLVFIILPSPQISGWINLGLHSSLGRIRALLSWSQTLCWTLADFC